MAQPTPQERWEAAGRATDGFEAYDLLYSAWPEPKTHRRFILKRAVDHSGVSGTGRVADGVLWTDGSVTLRWHGEHASLVHWQSMEHMLAVHGHAGDTTAAFIDPEDEV